MMTVRRPFFAVLAVAGLLLSGCSRNDAATTPAGGEELTIGLLTPLSGPNVELGVEARRGAELAVEVINGLYPSIPLPLAAEAGLPRLGGARVRVVTENSAVPDPARAQAVAGRALHRLVAVQEVDALIGAFDPQVTEYASQRSERYGVPFVTADSPATYLTDSGRDWFFRVGPSWRSFVEVFFSAMSQGGHSLAEVVVLHARDKAGQNIKTTVDQLSLQGGLPKPGSVSFPADGSDADLFEAVDRVRSMDPDAVLVYVTPQTADSLLKAYAASGYKPKAALAFTLGFTGPLPATLAPSSVAASDGLLRAVSWSSEVAQRSPTARAVAELYQRRFGAPMSEAAASEFTAVMTIAQATNDAGAVDRGRLRSALLSLDVPGADLIMPWSGIRFDEAHQNVFAQSLLEQTVGGVTRVVYPRDLADGPTLVYPAPRVVR